MEQNERWDYEGYISRNGMVRSDGVMFTRESFIRDDGKKVPIIYGFNRDTPLGYASLENREDGVYTRLNFIDQASKRLLCETDDYTIGFDANRIVREGTGHGYSIIKSGSIMCVNVYPKPNAWTYKEK